MFLAGHVQQIKNDTWIISYLKSKIWKEEFQNEPCFSRPYSADQKCHMNYLISEISYLESKIWKEEFQNKPCLAGHIQQIKNGTWIVPYLIQKGATNTMKTETK